MFYRYSLKSMYLALLAVVLVLAACGGAAQPATTSRPEEDAIATAAPIEEPTATSAPVAETEAGDSEASGLNTYVIVPGESTASYLVDEEFLQGALAKLGIQAGLVDVVGSTQEIEGQLQLDLDNLASPLGANRFEVNLASLTTDQSRRDNWIRENGPEFNKHPLAEFRATGIEGAPDSYTEGEQVQFKLVGDLTIREVTQPVTFDVTASLEGDTITGVATASLLLSDFGIDPPNFANTLAVEDEFEVKVEFTAREQ